LGVHSEDTVLVLCNEPQRPIAEALSAASRKRARTTRLFEYETLSRNSEEPAGEIAAAMLEASVVFATTAYSLSHTKARLVATAAGARLATMNGLTEDLFARALPIDYARLRTASGRLAAALTAAKSCRLTSAAGTEITLSIEDRRATADDGHLQQPGAFGNLPAGEAYIARWRRSATARSSSTARSPPTDSSTSRCASNSKNGRAVAADGEGAAWLLSTLDAGGEHGRSIAEIGIGTNPAPYSAV
jgi:leucyl aminopeptidase (aminopeptidase T)